MPNTKLYKNNYSLYKTIVENYNLSNYTKVDMKYPYKTRIEDTSKFTLNNYDVSGTVSTNLNYNIKTEAPGLSWIN